MSLAEKLRYYRYQKGLRQAEVAKILGISRDTYGAFETGKKKACPEEMSDKLSRLYEINKEDIS